MQNGHNKGQKWYGPTILGPQKQKILRRGVKNTQKNYTRKDLHDPDNHDSDHPPRARHPGVRSQVGLKKHHYEQS